MNQATFRVRVMGRVLGLSRSGYDAWVHRPPSRRSQENEHLRARMRTLHTPSGGSHGVPRIFEDLVDEGIHVSRKRFAR